MLRIENLSFSFSTHGVLKNLSLILPKGEIGCLIGASGSGKTTFFKLLTGMLHPDFGSIFINEIENPKGFSQVAYMTQDSLLLPWRTVLENLMLIGELAKEKIPFRKRREEARYYLREIELEQWEKAYPDQLSGGMSQRVSLARALLQKRPLLLLDEPFAALDVNMREQMHELLRTLVEKDGLTILMITHDFRDAVSLSSRVFLLKHGCISQGWDIPTTSRENLSSHYLLHQEMQSAMNLS